MRTTHRQTQTSIRIYLVEYRFLGVRGLPWGDNGGSGGVTEETLSDRVE